MDDFAVYYNLILIHRIIKIIAFAQHPKKRNLFSTINLNEFAYSSSGKFIFYTTV